MPEAETDLGSEMVFGSPNPDASASVATPAFEATDGATPLTSPAAGTRWLADPAHHPMPPSSPALRAPRPRTAPQVGRLAAIGIAFAAGLALALAVFVSVALGIAFANTDRVMPGVHVGAVDVSGLTRDEAVNKLRNAYSYLAQGDVEITTPAGTSAVTYSTIGRSPDAEAMADAALGAGRTGDPLSNSLTTWRSLIGGQDIPVAIRINPEAVSESVRSLTLASALLPRDAAATLMYGTFTYWPSAQGSVIDEDAISQAIVAHLTEPNAPARFRVGSALVTLEPKVSDAAAKRAIETAEHMAIDVTLTLDPSATPSPAASGKTPVPTKTYVVPAATIPRVDRLRHGRQRQLWPQPRHGARARLHRGLAGSGHSRAQGAPRHLRRDRSAGQPGRGARTAWAS